MRFGFLVMVGMTWLTPFAHAYCPVSVGELGRFPSLIASRAGDPSLKDLLKECSKSDLKTAKTVFEQVTYGIRMNSVDDYINGNLNVLTGGENAADKINGIVAGQIGLGLVERELNSRR